MDRLVIESIFSDVEEIILSDDQLIPELGKSIILRFSTENTEQVKSAFSTLKNLIQDKKVEFIICRTLISGVYDLEIKTDALDEPIRIVNKAIRPELLSEIEGILEKSHSIAIGTNVTSKDYWVLATHAQVKECTVK